MAYQLERFSILVVEDSLFIRSIIVRTLKALGVGIVNTASNGAEAIEFMRQMTQDERKAGLMSIDIVITDWVMDPVDGLMLLRWIRRHKESPDRFMPVLMLTGNTDIDGIIAARDMGVTEMMTKPFSMKTLTDKVQSIIDNPRQFIQAPTYFGPDRRRRQMPLKVANRRVMKEAEMEVHYVG
jgi:two-component system, chemotaxis family, chemotaxis protein CheY